MTIGTLLQTRPVFTIQARSTVADAAVFMTEKNVGALPVFDGPRLVGIFSERDVITRVVARHLDPGTIIVEQVMTRDLVIADSAENEESCLRKMKAANCRHLPVVSGETIVGIISLRDLLQVELSEREDKLEFLNSYIFHLAPGAENKLKS